jgi:UDP-glucose 4-epimerase
MIDYISSGNYDIVFHQAAVPRVSYSVENPGETTFENIYKTVELFKACAGNVKRVVWASSSSVYAGASTMPTPESERGKVLPKSPYAWQKFAIEDFAKLCSHLYNLDIVCLRYFNVFGPGQQGDSPYSTAVSAWCHATKHNLALRSDGDGEQTRDLCYIDNTVQANILAATSSRIFNGRCYNIACGDRTSNNEILNYFKSNFDVKVVNAPERQGDVKHTQADISRAAEELGYSPDVKFWDGLERTLLWWGLNDNL